MSQRKKSQAIDIPIQMLSTRELKNIAEGLKNDLVRCANHLSYNVLTVAVGENTDCDIYDSSITIANRIKNCKETLEEIQELIEFRKVSDDFQWTYENWETEINSK